MTQERTWRAGRFWWDWSRPSEAILYPLRAVIFDLDALADIESDGHRVVFNAAFAAHGLDIQWTVARYRKLLALSDERQRVAAELRARGVCTECDVLNKLLVDEIVSTKTMMFEEMIADADLAPRSARLRDGCLRRGRPGGRGDEWSAKLGGAVGAAAGR
jgi:hypothetical protein